MNLCNLSEIKELLGRHGFRFSKSMGQNFLIDKRVPQSIADSIEDGDGVLEVGPGIGPLTVELCDRASKVVAVELDKTLLPVLDETLADFDNVTVINSDILKTNIRAIVDEHFQGLHPVACANLPYYITSPAISALVDSKCFDYITVMIQKEVALRICAKAGSSDYGAFSVYCRYHTEPEILFHVPPSCFYPQPKVTSSVIKLKCRKTPLVEVDEKLFFKIVKLSFAQRRKTLVNGLAAGLPLSKSEITEIIVSCGYPENVRGETLDVEDFAKITNAVKERI
ncbi:MAG: 16S rRNA (adenine(1518)-N(6)/adenine(1519)-N(6))-dimethyltransferase RsmA [Ruminococcaceae bacterium]|nr:16S rRNA (adenine(1518)-N(6)/adenine(1519)-N(6))-dimethyltransferase RsmA [Oscillospiraceae bacterium]